MRSAFAVVTLTCCTSLAFAVSTPLRITEVNCFTGQVEVTNTDVTTYTAPNNLPFSHQLNTASVIPSGTAFGSGESKSFTVTSLNATDSDLWLYKDTNFASAASIESGLKYGPAANVGEVSVAVTAGIWPSTSAFVATQTSPSQSLRLIAYDGTKTASWAEAAPNFGSFFGTGTVISNPLPPIPKGSQIIELTTVVANMVCPLGMDVPDDNSNRTFIYDQGGTVTLLIGGVAQPTPFLSVANRLVPLGLFPPANYDERGLLGFTSHPNFAVTKKVYTYTSEPATTPSLADFTTTQPLFGFDHQDVIAEWQVDNGNPNIINVSTRREILRINHPQFNHDGGTLRFGPDGKLYFSIGDGGQGDDVGEGHAAVTGNAQLTNTIFGKIHRIDPDGNNSTNGKYGIPAGNPFPSAPNVREIFAYGLRNPYAFSFDQLTGQLYVGDAGQNKIEEADIVTSGANCGWHWKEGSFFFNSAGSVVTIPILPLPPNLTEPLVQYDHDDGSVIIGGAVYRGSAMPALLGRYITGEFGSFSSPTGRLFYVDVGNVLKEFQIGTTDRPFGLWLKGIGQDRNGEIYLFTSQVLGPFGTTGAVLKIVPLASVEEWKLY